MSEASYTHAVAATTLNGGTTSSTLNDAFDGYNTLCLSLNNTVANCETGNANFVIYNKNGPATTECLGAASGVEPPGRLPRPDDRQHHSMQRKVFVPDNDSFGRWLNYFTNTGATPQTVTAVIANNLGSDNNTKIVTCSNGNATAEVTDTWIKTPPSSPAPRASGRPAASRSRCPRTRRAAAVAAGRTPERPGTSRRRPRSGARWPP